MKKVVITILLSLPFVLIYFISFTGRILSTYSHIYVERITVLNSNDIEYESGDTITIAKGEVYNLKIKIYPELATDKTVIFSNSNKNVCAIEDETNNVIGLDYGISRIIITSKDRHFVQYTINIKVSDNDIQDIILDKTEVHITKGKSVKINTSIYPNTVLPENRILLWESEDTSVATVSNGIITGVDDGDTTVIVRSAHRQEIYKEITVHVASEYEPGVYFINNNPNGIYEANSPEFNLRAITFVKLDGVSLDNVWYELNSTVDENSIDVSDLRYGNIVFYKERVSVIVYVYVKDNNGNLYSDKIIIWYVKR